MPQSFLQSLVERAQDMLATPEPTQRRALKSTSFDRADYDKVVAERDQYRQAAETDQEKALREAKDAGANEAREQVFTETATAMLRMALRGHGITKDDDLDEIVAATNLAHFKGDDGAIDDQKVAALAKRMAGTAGAQQWPDMGQGKPPAPPVSQKELGIAEARKRHPDAFPAATS